MEDERLIELFWNRSEMAIQETAYKYGNYLHHISMNILQCAQDAGECVNDTYFKAWNSIPPQRPNMFQSWIGRIARNISIDRYRRDHAKKRGGYGADLLLSELEDCIPCQSLGSGESSDEQISEILNIFLGDLKKINRMIFMRRYWYGDSIGEIAARFDMKESRVKTSLYRSRNLLRSRLEKGGIRI